MIKHKQTVKSTVEILSDPTKVQQLFHEQQFGYNLPSQEELQNIIDILRRIMFPGFYGHSQVNPDTIKYHIGVDVEMLHKKLRKQVLSGLCFVGKEPSHEEDSPRADFYALKDKARQIATDVIRQLPQLRDLLAMDIEAAYLGDPAADSQSEIITCYPCIKALTNYRLAHQLFLAGVPIIPRMLTEMAHSETGIDIHPGAQIGHHFCIDHGTGVVIGSTTIIGNHVKLYQGVTLGAKSFPLDENGNPIKGIPRHPIIGNNVIVYANATILGRITIAEGTIISANQWVTKDIYPPPRSHLA
ncbi:MAG: serine acetyltransferase [Bacteroidaceae bacterium]|nr:serine acetyltransferase [Bacteroidaceae bacterium]